MVASSNVTVTLCTGSSALLASPSIKAPPLKRDQPCYCAAAAVYTGLRKDPCEPGGNCVKSPCELPVRWLADG